MDTIFIMCSHVNTTCICRLYRNHLGDEGVTVVCPALCQAKSLKQIRYNAQSKLYQASCIHSFYPFSFTKNDIRDDGACELANYVRKTQTLDQIRYIM